MPTQITNTSISTDSITAPTITGSTSVTTPTVNVNTIDPTQGYLSIAQQNATGEGGEILLAGSNGNANAVIDNNNGAIRILQGANNRLNIDTNGYVTMPQQPHCMLYKSGNQSISAATPTNVTGWGVSNGLNSMHDSTNHRIVAPAAGIYILGGMVQFSANGGAHIALLKNNATVGNDSYLDNINGGSNSYSMVIPMSQNDFVSMTVYMTVNANVNQNRTKLWLVKVA